MNKEKLNEIFLEINELKDAAVLEYNDMLRNRYEEEYSASEIEYTKANIDALYQILFAIYKLATQ
jgi:hypothetical protein